MWNGEVRIVVEPEVESELELRIRVPGWSREQPVPTDLYRFADAAAAKPSFRSVSDASIQVEDGFAIVRRTWKAGEFVELTLPMPVRRVVAHANVEENAGKVALQRGPLVFAFEGIDNGGRVSDLILPEDVALTAEFRPDLLGGVVTIRTSGVEERHRGIAIPYFAWANRGAGEMAVWLPMR